MIKKPDFLKVGDKVAIIAPARKLPPETLEKAVEVFRQWGLEVVFGKHLSGDFHQFAGTDLDRTEDLQNMLDNREIKAIICARGGYGVLRIIDHLCWDGLRKYPKWIIGFSDITVLLSHIHNATRLQTLHGPMPYSFFHNDLTPETIESLRKALFGEPLSYSWDYSPYSRKGKAKGQLAGGNLSMLFAMQGSPSEYNYENKILFIEDLDEYLYHIDRMMLGLKRSGRLSRLKGLIVGGMTDLKDNAIPFGKTVEEIIREAVGDYSYPVAFGFPAGHGNENHSLFIGAEVELVVDDQHYLTFK